MISSWTVTEPEQRRIVRDGLRAKFSSGQALFVDAYFVVLILVGLLVGGWPLALFALVVVAVCECVVVAMWQRELRRGVRTAYPAGSTATSELSGDKLRLVDAVATVEIDVAHLRKPRVCGSVVTVVKPGTRWRRTALPRVLVPDEVVAAMSRHPG